MLAAMAGLFVFHEKSNDLRVHCPHRLWQLEYLPDYFLAGIASCEETVSGDDEFMGLFVAQFIIAMGLASDAVGQSGAVAVMTIGVATY